MDIDIERDIRSWCATNELVDAVLGSTPPVVHEGGIFHYHVPGSKRQLLRGLTAVIRDVLVYKHPIGKKGTARKTLEEEEGMHLSSPALFAHGSMTGIMRGSRVHREIEDAIAMPTHVFLRKYPEGMHTLTYRTLAAIDEKGWRPIKAEFIVYDLELKIATRIDVLAVNKEGKILVVENKTGYAHDAFLLANDGEWCKDPMVAAILGHLPCTPKNISLIQATISLLMLVRMLRFNESMIGACVVQTDDDNTRWCPVSHDFVEGVGVPLYALFKLKGTTTRRKK